MLAPEEQTSTIHPEVIYDSTKELVDEMITEGPTSSSAPSSDFIQQWLRHVQDVNEGEPSTFAVPVSRKSSRTLWSADGRGVFNCSTTSYLTAPK